MSLSRREFTQVLAMAGVAGFALGRWAEADAAQASAALYEVPPPFSGPGAVSLMHMTDCHAQLKPIRFREPSVNLGVADMQRLWPHLVGSALLREWVDDSAATVADLDALAEPDERAWLAERDQLLLYR